MQIYNINEKALVLTCCEGYNDDFQKISNEKIRERLFASYELI
jgi:hypothetical protein